VTSKTIKKFGNLEMLAYFTTYTLGENPLADAVPVEEFINVLYNEIILLKGPKQSIRV
jgi:hypothetical protein